VAVDEILAVELAKLLEAWYGRQRDGHVLVVAVIPGCWCGGCAEGVVGVGRDVLGVRAVVEKVWRGVEEEELWLGGGLVLALLVGKD